MGVFSVWNAVLLLCFVSTISAGAHGGCDRSAEDAYSSMAPDPTFAFVGVSWPGGTYTLIKPDTGCPQSWLEGWRFQDNENNNNKNKIHPGHHLFGIPEHSPSNFNFSYCTRVPENLGSEGNWPSGNYCIMRHGNTCPGGFENGSIFWDDENFNNNNSAGGLLPSGQYNEDTLIHYCCRKDGQFNSPIELPTAKPFHLLRFVSPCQMVKGMEVVEIRVYFDDENDSNKDYASGMHPLGSGISKHDNSLVYCYYNPTQ